MIDNVLYAVKTHIDDFLRVHYTSGTDINTDTDIYTIHDFDPQDRNSYKPLLNEPNYSVVIHDWSVNNLLEHPHSHLKIEFNCSITFVSKNAAAWDKSNEIHYVYSGSSATPAINPVTSITLNYAKYTRANHIVKDTLSSYWEDVTSIEYGQRVGEYWFPTTCRLRALFMESKTISVTPV